MVSRRVIQAAHDTEAVNRAGQLRMLSQRIVKLHALRQAGVASGPARSLLQASVAQVTANLDHLARELSKLTFGDLLAAATNRWRALSALLDRDGDAAALGPIDAAAEELLVAAEALPAALAAIVLLVALRMGVDLFIRPEEIYTVQ